MRVLDDCKLGRVKRRDEVRVSSVVVVEICLDCQLERPNSVLCSLETLEKGHTLNVGTLRKE